MEDLHISKTERDGLMIVSLSGEAHFDDGDMVLRKLLPLQPEPNLRVVFDLSGLSFVATLILGELNEFRRGILAHGGKMVLAGLQPQIRQVFSRSRLDEIFPIAADVETAIAQLKS